MGKAKKDTIKRYEIQIPFTFSIDEGDTIIHSNQTYCTYATSEAFAEEITRLFIKDNEETFIEQTGLWLARRFDDAVLEEVGDLIVSVVKSHKAVNPTELVGNILVEKD